MKLKCFQINGICSKNTFLPFLGDLGLKSNAGVSVSIEKHEANVASTFIRTAIIIASPHIEIWGTSVKSATVYTIFHALNIILGKVKSPSTHPSTPPAKDAKSA